MAEENKNVEYIVVLRCRKCGDALSIGPPFSYEEVAKAIRDFYEAHQHTANPWII